MAATMEMGSQQRQKTVVREIPECVGVGTVEVSAEADQGNELPRGRADMTAETDASKRRRPVVYVSVQVTAEVRGIGAVGGKW